MPSHSEEPALTTLVGRLAGDARAAAAAEMTLVKVRLFAQLAGYKAAAIFFAAAAVLALAALIALLVGLIQTLATLIGPGWATLLVIGVTLVVAAVLGLIGKSRLDTMKAALKS